MAQTLNVSVPADIVERGKSLRLNLSSICRRALAEEVLKVEKERSESGRNLGGQTPDIAASTSPEVPNESCPQC